MTICAHSRYCNTSDSKAALILTHRCYGTATPLHWGDNTVFSSSVVMLAASFDLGGSRKKLTVPSVLKVNKLLKYPHMFARRWRSKVDLLPCISALSVEVRIALACKVNPKWKSSIFRRSGEKVDRWPTAAINCIGVPGRSAPLFVAEAKSSAACKARCI